MGYVFHGSGMGGLRVGEGQSQPCVTNGHMHNHLSRWLNSPRESREGLEPRLKVRVGKLFSEKVTSEVGLEGQKEDLAMTRKAEGWGLCPRVLRAFR